MTLTFSLTTFTTRLFCKGVTRQQSTERQRLARSTKRSCRSDDRAMVRVRPSITREMSGVVSMFRGSSLYLLTSSNVQSKMDVHVSWKTTSAQSVTFLKNYWQQCVISTTKGVDDNRRKRLGLITSWSGVRSWDLFISLLNSHYCRWKSDCLSQLNKNITNISTFFDVLMCKCLFKPFFQSTMATYASSSHWNEKISCFSWADVMAFKASMRNFHFVLTVAAHVDKSGTAYCH